MESFKYTKEIIENLKPEHLAEGVNPIIACVDERGYYSDDINLMDDNAFNVDYYKNRPYVISAIDSGDKYTDTLYNCTSVVCVGVDKETGEEISFLTHQDPKSITEHEYFIKDLHDRLFEMKNRCTEGTVDIVIAGGFSVSNYDEYMTILNTEVKQTLGFSPVVISGPKESGGYDSHDGVYFDTKKRRVYITRPKDYEKYNEPFVADDLDKAGERWKKAD